jgi:hypothetical protein
MKISELIALLRRRLDAHGDAQVVITWEGIFRYVEARSIYLDSEGDLLIDADENYYKPRFAKDPREGEDGR